MYGRKREWRGPGALGVFAGSAMSAVNAGVKGRVALWYLVAGSLLA